MDDLISRVAAINAFMNATADGDKVDFCIGVVRAVPSVQRLDEDGTFWINIDNFDDDFDKINRVVFDDGFWCETFYQDAQPVDKDINVPTNDIISRKAAIDAICKHYTDLERRGITCLAITNHKQVSVDLLESLPSAQPEIIYCKDCKYNYGLTHNGEFNPDDIVCTFFDTDGMQHCDFCSYAERANNELV